MEPNFNDSPWAASQLLAFLAIVEIDFNNPLWVASQIFAFLALIFSIWAWQVKEKVRLMLLVGTFSILLAVSASLLENYTLGVLFGLAGIRNFVFCYFEWRKKYGKLVIPWLPYFFAAVFIVAGAKNTANW